MAYGRIASSCDPLKSISRNELLPSCGVMLLCESLTISADRPFQIELSRSVAMLAERFRSKWTLKWHHIWGPKLSFYRPNVYPACTQNNSDSVYQSFSTGIWGIFIMFIYFGGSIYSGLILARNWDIIVKMDPRLEQEISREPYPLMAYHSYGVCGR